MTRLGAGDRLWAKVLCGSCGDRLAGAIVTGGTLDDRDRPKTATALRYEPAPTALGWFCTKCRHPRTVSDEDCAELLTRWTAQMKEHVERIGILSVKAH